MDVKVMVYPEEGNFAVVARGLLAVADHPGQVRSVSHPRAGFEVPEEIFERFESAADSTGGEPEHSDVSGHPRKRRPGRPAEKPLLTPEELEAAIAEGTPDSDTSKEE